MSIGVVKKKDKKKEYRYPELFFLRIDKKKIISFYLV